jgi:acetyl-CoA C-acetyltransferase
MGAMRTSVIVAAARTPIGTFGGALKSLSASELAAVAIREAVQRARLEPDAVEEVVLGCIHQSGEDGYIARLAAVKAGLPVATTAYSVNRQCGSGLQAVVSAGQEIACGNADVVVAGGTEHMSSVPFVAREVRWGARLGDVRLEDGLLTLLSCPFDRWHMGVTAERVVERYGISREDQDEFALLSQQRAAAAIAAGRFCEQIVPIDVPDRRGTLSVEQDEHPRPDTTREKLGALRPTYQEGGTITAGNACGINDGAAALVLMSAAEAARRGIASGFRVRAAAVAGVEPAYMGIGPVPAIRQALRRADLTLDEVDLVELNEAFAGQALAVIREVGLDLERTNVNGGAIALGHPVGATGAILTVKLLAELERRGLDRGLVSLCIGGGQGIAAIFERVQASAVAG